MRNALETLVLVVCLLWTLVFSMGRAAAADAPLGGFIPFLGIGLTNQFDTFDEDVQFFIADRSTQWGGSPLGPGSGAYFDLALLDTGSAAHILTQAAASATGFNIQGEGFRGTNFQQIFGASGALDMRINDPLGVYAGGLGDRASAGSSLVMNTPALRGQTSVSMLEAPAEWSLPNVIGLPMAAQHGIVIRNDQPQIFQYQGKTVRTPNINLIDLGTGGQQGLTRRTEMKLHPSASFISGPLYIQSTEIGGGLDFNFHDNPLSPTVVDSGGLFVEVDAARAGRRLDDKEFLFDTGADITVVSQLTAARLGFDVLHDAPDFFLEVEGAGGVSAGVPGFYLDELTIDTVGGSFTLQHVPVAVRDLPNPNDPANVVPGILGTHLFTGRNIVIDADPAPNQTNAGPRLYIGDPVYETRSWVRTTSGGWSDVGSWSPGAAAMNMWDAQARATPGASRTAMVDADSTVYRMTVGGSGGATMTVQIEPQHKLTTYGEALIESGGSVRLNQGGKLDAQFVNIDGGSLVGSGQILVGTGPVTGVVRNLGGLVAPDTLGSPVGSIQISGDLSNTADGVLAFDIGGTTAGQYDTIIVDRFAFLGGELKVSLVDLGGGAFNPALGTTFSLLTATNIFGTFSAFDLPMLPAGRMWSVSYGSTALQLKVTLPGDFDGNGTVNSADLVVFKGGVGGQYSGADYLAWQRYLGQSVGAVAAVPEPSAAALFGLALLGFVRERRLSRKR